MVPKVLDQNKDKTDSNLNDISITSFPSKPLGCCGDGGAVFTNNEDYAKKIKLLRVHGQNKRYLINCWNWRSFRYHQAAILNAKLPSFHKELKDRQKIADLYTRELRDFVKTPIIRSDRSSAWAQYTIRSENRNNLQLKLKEKGIPISVFYPIPLHLQQCFSYLGYNQGDILLSEKASKEVMSLPMNPFLTKDQIIFIAETIKEHI